jgi:hypothetical protein
MEKPMVRIYTDAENFIDREMNAEEYTQWKKDNKAVEAELAQIQAKTQAKAELLERLGITEDEAKLLLA